MLMPAFHRHPDEAAIIGRMLAGYGELEFMFAQLLGWSLGNEDLGLRTFFRVGSESARLTVADAIIYPAVNADPPNVGTKYGAALGSIKICLGLRNCYAHCHWADDPRMAGLFFTNAHEPAKKHSQSVYLWRHVDKPILITQEHFFVYTMRQLMFVTAELRYVRENRKAPHPHEWPTYISPPTEHNPPETHFPPWLEKDTSNQPSAHPRKRRSSK